MNYGMPWIRPTAGFPVSDTTLMPIAPASYHGMASDRNAGQATQATLSHLHRFSPLVELTTKLRVAEYERDQRASTVRFAAAALQPNRLAVSLATFGPSTVLTRGTQLKIQDMQTAHAQSDLSAKFEALGLRHELLTGVDLAQEKKRVQAARSAAQGGVNLIKPYTTVGTPDDGASIDEDSRVLRTASHYVSRGYGLYVQDLVQITPTWKLLAGLRFDHLSGDYTSYAVPNATPGPETATSYRMSVSELSQRAGLLWQPNDRMSFHLSGATSFNTSGDAYSLSAANVGIPPEQTINLELGAKLDSEDGNFSTRLALFRSTKLHERNTDPLVNLVTLSGRRHAAGVEIDVSGRLSRQWEVYASYLWMPVAKIDQGVAGSEGEGTRPSQTPRHSGTVWSTYQINPRLRLGGGLTAMSPQTPIRNPGWAAPGYLTADLMAEYAVIANRLTVKANLANVGGKLYASALYSGHYVPGPGRALQLTASYKF
jgi:catecholate siderophore receptor